MLLKSHKGLVGRLRLVSAARLVISPVHSNANLQTDALLPTGLDVCNSRQACSSVLENRLRIRES